MNGNNDVSSDLAELSNDSDVTLQIQNGSRADKALVPVPRNNQHTGVGPAESIAIRPEALQGYVPGGVGCRSTISEGQS